MTTLFRRTSCLAGAAICALAVTGPSALAQTPSAVRVCTMTPAEIYAKAAPAVVFISTRSINPYRLSGRVDRGVGSGFILDRSGLVITNSHVVFGAQSIAVTLDDGRSAPARIVGIDPIFDLALLRIPVAPETNLPTLELEDDALVRVGDEVVAIGNPLGLDQTLTRGVVSALNRELAGTPLSFSRPMIQTDTPINPGNSGGPLLDRCGRVVGINTSIIADAQGIGFAIPATLVASVVPVLIRDGGIARPWLGFHGQLVTPRLAALLRIPLVLGLLVEVVEPDSPAAKAKIRGGVTDISIAGNEILIGGDIVTEMNGIKLVSDAALARAMQTMAVGKALRLRLYRDGEHFTVSYRTPKRPILPSDVQY